MCLDARNVYRVHPRVCGGTADDSAAVPVARGASPRVRGNQVSPAWFATVLRCIPACAGEPIACRASESLPWVHPRVCGGTSSRPDAIMGARGASPRVRGNQPGGVDHAALRGCIPACAGEPTTRCRGHSRSTVHPRVCGGTPKRDGIPSPQYGASPRVRGNRKGQMQDAPDFRCIPACAGEPAPDLRKRHEGRVHPRVCGGTDLPACPSRTITGASPRVRGNPEARADRAVPPGCIPACAGEPRGRSHRPSRRRVHPRVCGGTPDQPAR